MMGDNLIDDMICVTKTPPFFTRPLTHLLAQAYIWCIPHMAHILHTLCLQTRGLPTLGMLDIVQFMPNQSLYSTLWTPPGIPTLPALPHISNTIMSTVSFILYSYGWEVITGCTTPQEKQVLFCRRSNRLSHNLKVQTEDRVHHCIDPRGLIQLEIDFFLHLSSHFHQGTYLPTPSNNF